MLVINEVDCVVDGDFVYFEIFFVSYYLFLSMFDVRCFLLCIVYLDLLLCRQMVECLYLGISVVGNKFDIGSVGKGNLYLQVRGCQVKG